MAVPKDAVLVKVGMRTDGGMDVAICYNRICHGIYKAYVLKGGSTYRLFTEHGRRYLSPAPVDSFLALASEIKSSYAYY